VVDGELAVRQLMTTSVSFDHRIVDGAYAARFLAHLRDLLEDPGLLAAF
jgi:pyruvate dehydrogenase E2 component (dihydrolipoamide acetyltransferase)